MPSVTGHRIWFHGRCTAPSYSCVEIVKISRGYPPLNWIAATCGLSLSLSLPPTTTRTSPFRPVTAAFLLPSGARFFCTEWRHVDSFYVKAILVTPFTTGDFKILEKREDRLSLFLLLRDNRKWIGMVVSCRVSIDNYGRCFLSRDWHVSLETCILSSEVNDKNKLRFISRQRRNVGYKRFYLNSPIYQSPRVI